MAAGSGFVSSISIPTGDEINLEETKCKHHCTGMAGFVSSNFGLVRIAETRDQR